jgi:hypothetical protein
MGLRPTQGDGKRLLSSNRSPWKRRPPLCHPERSRGICSSADLSWKCFSTERTPDFLLAGLTMGACAVFVVRYAGLVLYAHDFLRPVRAASVLFAGRFGVFWPLFIFGRCGFAGARSTRSPSEIVI